MTLLARGVLIVALSTGTACAGKHKAFIAPTQDYADYRATRTAPSVLDRLKAASLYLERHPDGAFRDEVSRWFERVEPLFYEASADSPAGMQQYLEALPKGPHAPHAEQRRDAFRAAAKAEAGEGISERGAEFERRLAAAAQSREDVLTVYAAWVSRLLDFDGWGRRVDAAKGDFASKWLAEPKPKCAPDRCTKLLVLPYELEVAGKPEKFVCMLEISLHLTDGRIAAASVSGPDLFGRLAEAHHARPFAKTPEARARAISWAIELTAGAAERRFPRRCARERAERAAMVRECDGWRLDLIPTAPPMEQDDRVVIRGRSEL